MNDLAALQNHIGREEHRHDIADPERLLRLAGLLDRKWTPADGMPPLGHFLLFRPDQRQSAIGEDGHPVRDPGGMLPDVPLPRRMWAGSRIQFLRPIAPGAALERRSRLVTAVPKHGNSGSIVLCTVAHEIIAVTDDLPVISEEQDIVYREAHRGPGLAPGSAPAPRFTPAVSRNFQVSPVMLFRYSALTFNAHRIHYDRDYARETEGYPGLVVHGPLLATFLFDHLAKLVPDSRITQFSFRAHSPCFDSEPVTVGASIENGKADLSVVGAAGLIMSGTACTEHRTS